MRQRVGIARVYCNEPEVLLMDEPFGHLDAQTRYLMQEELERIWQAEKRTIIFVTNHIEEALYLADRVLVMNAGRIAMYDATDKVFARAPELLELGLSVPEVTKIFLRLREMGLDIDTDVYTVKYAVKTILAARAAAKEGM